MITRRDALALPLTCLLPRQLAYALDNAADPTKFYTGDKKANDARLGPPKTLNSYFPFTVPKTKEAWEARRALVRERILVANGLWPLPEKTPLNPVIHGKVEGDGYTVEKVFFASTPGHYVSGNLYRPLNANAKGAKHPGALFAHGHWTDGRLHDAGEKAAKASVDSGGEPDLDRGRFFMQAIPVTLARMGIVCFQYDMIGVGDSLAIPHREGFKDAAAELRLQSFMGLQTWNSIRALDFLTSLPDVDPKRLGMTGASGGGTQTFILSAIDDRLTASFPAVMVGTGMQGGCVCENCSLLRVDSGNIELAAMFAPKPLAMSAANDWTNELLTKGFPELKELYKLYGVEEKVAAKAWLEYGHQYNVHARQFMYSWFSKHLLGEDAAITEKAYKPISPKELRVYDAEHPRPKDELDAAKLRDVLAKSSDAQIAKLLPKDAESLKEFQRVVGSALAAMVTDSLPKEIAVREGPLASTVDGLSIHRAVLGRKDEKEAIPGVGVFGPSFKGEKVVVWVHPNGKASLFEKGKAIPAVKALTDASYAIVACDLLGIGELIPAKPFAVDKSYAGLTFGYNRTLLANRVHDILTMVAFAKSMLKAKSIEIVGWGEMGPAAILAKALAGDAVAKIAADVNQFRFENVKDVNDPMLLPGAVKYGGLGAFVALCAPGVVLVHNHRGTAIGQLAESAYDAAGAKDKLTRSGDKLDDMKVVEWLIK